MQRLESYIALLKGEDHAAATRMSDPVSLESFAANRGDALLRFAYVLAAGDAARAEDLVQSALAKVIRRWPTIAAGGNPEAYLHRVIVTEDLSWRRRRSSREVVLARPPDRSRDDQTHMIDARDAAWRLVASLPRRQRAVVVLRYLDDWTDREISQALNCSEATVRSQASRALRALRARLDTSSVPSPEGEESCGD